MPRGPRLDAPGVLHHVMVRGIEGRSIFRDDRDREDLLTRLAALVKTTGLTVYAWALLPNHAHLLVRTEARPLGRVMRCLLTGYAGAFNRRYRRRGHLFQNRYKSVVVEEDRYFLELVRYLHLNPLRAGVVSDLPALDRYPWTGHSVIMGHTSRPWQSSQNVLASFGSSLLRARRQYRAFMAAGIPLGRRPELQGGGLVRSAGGWRAVHQLRRGREAYLSDERVLGGSDFVEELLKHVESRTPHRPKQIPLAILIRRVCAAVGIRSEALTASGRRPAVSRAREGIAYLWTEILGQNGRRLASPLGVQPPAVYKAAQRGSKTRTRWERLVEQ
jgi:REP element-mobilizing transposase RayT